MSHVHGLQVQLEEQISNEIQVSLSTIPDYTFFSLTLFKITKMISTLWQISLV